MRQNFEQIRPLLGDAADLRQLDALEAWTEANISRLEPLLATRAASGAIRECHGDLHLGDATLLDGEVVLFDCIEFNEPFRLIDIASDAAFLAMDLEDRGLKALSRRFVSAWLEHTWGWREACATWAVLHLVLGLPLNLSLPSNRLSPQRPERQSSPGTPSSPATTAPAAASHSTPAQPPRRVAWALAYVFAATWFVSTAMAAHLPQMLMAHGASLSAAVATAALVGPAQVAGRLVEYGLMQRWHPVWSARLATLAHPLGATLWLALGPVASPVFAVLHGAGNGVLTIAKGTLPLALFGPSGFGQRQGWIMAPSRVAQAFGMRRVDHAIAALVRDGAPLQLWRIRRLSGLRKWSDVLTAHAGDQVERLNAQNSIRPLGLS